RGVAEARAAAAASAAHTRRDEIRALLAALEPRGQRGLFDPPARTRTAAEWVSELEASAIELSRREDHARAALDDARADAERPALEAREAMGRRRETATRLSGARSRAEAAIARAGFDDLAALRAALLDPAALDALEAELTRLDQARAELAAVLAERRR